MLHRHACAASNCSIEMFAAKLVTSRELLAKCEFMRLSLVLLLQITKPLYVVMHAQSAQTGRSTTSQDTSLPHTPSIADNGMTPKSLARRLFEGVQFASISNRHIVLQGRASSMERRHWSTSEGIFPSVNTHKSPISVL